MSTLVIGVGGATSSGKTTACDEVMKRFSGCCAVLHMDAYYLSDDDPRLQLLSEYDYSFVYWDTVSAIDFDRMIADLETMLRDNAASMDSDSLYSDSCNQGSSVSKNVKVKDYSVDKSHTGHVNHKKVVLIDGILIYEYEPLQRFFTRKYFFTLTRDVAEKRRHARQYPRGEPASYFDHYAWPCYVKCHERVMRSRHKNYAGLESIQSPESAREDIGSDSDVVDRDSVIAKQDCLNNSAVMNGDICQVPDREQEFILLSGNDPLHENCRRVLSDISDLLQEPTQRTML